MYDELDALSGAYLKHKTLLITGAAGTVGNALIDRVLAFEPAALQVLW